MKSKTIFIIPLLLGVLYGCNSDTEVDKEDIVTGNQSSVDNTTSDTGTGNTGANDMGTDNTGTNNAGQNGNENQQNGTQAANVNFPFTYFELDVDYANDISYNAEYANDGNNIAAEFEDEKNNVDTNGDQAYNSIRPSLEKLTFDENSSDEDVRKEVIQAFGLDENYTEFELEVKFQNDKVKHYRDKK